MTRISSLAVDAAKKNSKMRIAAISGLVIAAVVIISFALLNESGDDVSIYGAALESGANDAAGQPASISLTSDGVGDATSSQQAGAKSPPDLRVGGAFLTGKAEDPKAEAGEDRDGEYPDGVVVAEDGHDDDYYKDDVTDGLMEGGGDGDDDAFLLDSPDGPPTDDMMDDGIAEEV